MAPRIEIVDDGKIASVIHEIPEIPKIHQEEADKGAGSVEVISPENSTAAPKADTPPIPVEKPQQAPLDPPADNGEDLLNSFKHGSVNPTIAKQIEDSLKAEPEPLSGLHASLLNSGTIEKWMVKILSNGLVGFNVWIYNLLFRGKKKVKRDSVELDDEDKLVVQTACEHYAPQIMEYIRKLPAPLVALLMVESSIIEKMNRAAIKVEKKKEITEPKTEAQ